MQHHRLLTAALSLETFSAGELSGAAGVPLNTTRSELARKSSLFAPVEDLLRTGKRGRPAQRYRLQDPDGARAVLDAARRDMSLPVVEDEELEAAEDQLLTLELAEHALRRALLSDHAEDRGELAVTAITTAERALESLEAMPDPERERRARAVRDFATHLQDRLAPRKAKQEALSVAAAGALTAFECVPGLAAGPLLAALVWLATRAGAPPPVALVTQPDIQPSDALEGLRSSGWSRRWLAGDWLWSPAWAEPLLEHHFLAGVVICGDDETELTRQITEVQQWRLPTIVACRLDSTELQARVFAQGATPLPTPDAEIAFSWLSKRLIDHTHPEGLTFEEDFKAPALARP
jgi:hypothetical protein